MGSPGRGAEAGGIGVKGLLSPENPHFSPMTG